MDICKLCGSGFTRRRTGGPKQVFCSVHCAKRFHNLINNAKHKSTSALAQSMAFGKIARTKTLSDTEMSVLNGTLLGDGSLIGVKHKRLSLSHCEAQLPYMLWKSSMLPTIFARQTPNVCKSSGFGKGKPFYVISSVWHPYLDALHSEIYISGIKHVGHDLLKNFNSLSLAVWYQDDGSYMRDSRAQQVVFCTDAFQGPDVNMLIDMLRTNFSLKCGKYSSASYGRIYVSRLSLSDFFDLVRPHIHPCLSYKIPGESSLSC